MSGAPSLFESRGSSGLLFGKTPPIGISRPPVGLKPLSRQEDPFAVKKEWCGVADSTIWDVKGEDLEQIPLGFQLERTHREIRDADAAEVASRITKTLCQLSIEAEYDCKQAKAKCKTNDYVGFRIRLFAGGENGQPVVVEVQRRCGSASSFMRSCRAILDAAEGKTVAVPAQKKLPPFKPVSQMKCLQSVIKQEEKKDDGSEAALDGVLDMLRSKRSDLNVLGLENLVCLTDPLKTCPVAALRVSRCVAVGDDKFDVREEIRMLTERDVFASGFEEEETAARHMDHLRHLALQIFANSLSMCSKDGCLSLACEQKWFADHLIPSLVDELKRARSSACKPIKQPAVLQVSHGALNVPVGLLPKAGVSMLWKRRLSMAALITRCSQRKLHSV